MQTRTRARTSLDDLAHVAGQDRRSGSRARARWRQEIGAAVGQRGAARSRRARGAAGSPRRARARPRRRAASCSRIGSPGARPISVRMASKSSSDSVSVPSRSKITARGAAAGAFTRGRLGRAARARDVLGLDLVGVHAARPLGHRRQQLVERRRLALDEAQRVDARDHEARRYGLVNPRALSVVDRLGHRVVEREQQLGAPLALGDGVGELPRQPAVDLAQDRVVGAARQPRRASRRRSRASPAPAPRTRARSSSSRRRRAPRRQIAVHAPHADRLLAQVVRLLDVERQDLVGDRALGDQQRQRSSWRRAPSARSAGGSRSASSSRPASGRLAHDDDRIEEALGLVHRLRQAPHVGVGDVALERRRRRPCRRAAPRTAARGRPAARGRWPARRRRRRATASASAASSAGGVADRQLRRRRARSGAASRPGARAACRSALRVGFSCAIGLLHHGASRRRFPVCAREACHMPLKESPMPRMVKCAKLGKELPAYPLQAVQQRARTAHLRQRLAWRPGSMWLEHSKMIVNEYRLDLDLGRRGQKLMHRRRPRSTSSAKAPSSRPTSCAPGQVARRDAGSPTVRGSATSCWSPATSRATSRIAIASAVGVSARGRLSRRLPRSRGRAARRAGARAARRARGWSRSRCRCTPRCALGAARWRARARATTRAPTSASSGSTRRSIARCCAAPGDARRRPCSARDCEEDAGRAGVRLRGWRERAPPRPATPRPPRRACPLLAPDRDALPSLDRYARLIGRRRAARRRPRRDDARLQAPVPPLPDPAGLRRPVLRRARSTWCSRTRAGRSPPARATSPSAIPTSSTAPKHALARRARAARRAPRRHVQLHRQGRAHRRAARDLPRAGGAGLRVRRQRGRVAVGRGPRAARQGAHARRRRARRSRSCAAPGISLRPTFVPFTPLDDARRLPGALPLHPRQSDLEQEVDPVQLSIRLLIPPGSLLLRAARAVAASDRASTRRGSPTGGGTPIRAWTRWRPTWRRWWSRRPRRRAAGATFARIHALAAAPPASPPRP